MGSEYGVSPNISFKFIYEHLRGEMMERGSWLRGGEEPSSEIIFVMIIRGYLRHRLEGWGNIEVM